MTPSPLPYVLYYYQVLRTFSPKAFTPFTILQFHFKLNTKIEISIGDFLETPTLEKFVPTKTVDIPPPLKYKKRVLSIKKMTSEKSFSM